MSYKLEYQDSGRNINNLRYVHDITLMAESKEELKSFLRVKEESERAGLKLNIKKTKIMASSPITSWQREGGGDVEVATDNLMGSKNTVMMTAAMKIRHLLLDRKAMTNLDSV